MIELEQDPIREIRQEIVDELRTRLDAMAGRSWVALIEGALRGILDVAEARLEKRRGIISRGGTPLNDQAFLSYYEEVTDMLSATISAAAERPWKEDV